MKCPQCSTIEKGRISRCGNCGYRFVFHPKDAGISDNKFMVIIKQSSANDRFYFTKNQLFAAYMKCLAPKLAIYVCLLVVVPIGLVLLFDMGQAGWLFFTAIGVMLVWNKISKYDGNRTRFEQHVDSWQKLHPIDKLITAPKLQSPPPNYREGDIYAYGVEKILIVEHEFLVDLFVLNDFFAKEKVLIIARSGYPSYLLPLAIQIIKDQPDLKIFLLHDSTREGCAMHTELPFSVDSVRLLDLGLTPDMVAEIRQLRYLKPKKQYYQVPVDAIAYGALATALSASLSTGQALVETLKEENKQSSEDEVDFG